MSLLQLVNQFDPDKFEEEARGEFLDRKKALNKMGSWGKNLALSMVPLGAIAAFIEPARAQNDPRTVTEVLQYALTLEYLEATYYNMGTSANGLIPSEDQPTFQEIAKNENSHVNFLQAALGEDSFDSPSFNYNVAGLKPFENYDHFLLLSQAFEDTGVRAYKGQAGFLIQNDQVLTAALRIHSVEARHASAVRRIRGIQGWIPGNQSDFPDALQGVYLGDPSEDNVTQLGFDVTTATDVGRTQVTESFDEPLSANYVVNLVDPFITSN